MTLAGIQRQKRFILPTIKLAFDGPGESFVHRIIGLLYPEQHDKQRNYAVDIVFVSFLIVVVVVVVVVVVPKGVVAAAVVADYF